MDARPIDPPPRSLRVVAIAALLWNLAGLVMFAMQVSLSPGDIAAMPDGERQLYESTPMMLHVAFGVAVLSGVLASIGLWLRRGWAVPLFMVSLLAIAVQMALAYTLTPAWAVLGPAGAVLPVLLVLVAVAEWLYARKARMRGWLIA